MKEKTENLQKSEGRVSKEFIEDNWPLTGVEVKEMPKQGMGGQVSIIVSKEGMFTCKTAGSWKTPETLGRDLTAYDFLNEKKFPYISKLLHIKAGEGFINNQGKLTYLIEFIEGTHPKRNVETYAELGKITATLHNIQGFPFETNYRPKSAVAQAIEGAEKYPFKDEYIALLKNVPSFEKLPLVPIHTEITPGNVIQKPDGEIVVIDWDEVGLGQAVLDLGVGLINHLVTDDFKILEAEAKACFQSYFAVRPMSDSEKEYIFEAAVYWALIWVQFMKGEERKRLDKVKWALANKEKLTALYM